MKVKQMAKVVMKFVDENLPLILTIAAECGLVATVVSAVHDAPKARGEIERAKNEKFSSLSDEEKQKAWDESTECYDLLMVKLNAWEYFKCLAPVYWRTAVCVTGTGLCIFFAYHTQHKRYLAALGLLALREKDLEKYKEKVKELFGESKAEKVENELAKDVISNPPTDELNVFYTGEGIQLFYDTASHSWFRSSREAIDRAINSFNNDMLDQAARNDGEAELSVSDLIYFYGYQLMDSFELDRMKFMYNATQGDLLKADIRYAAHPRTQEVCGVITYNMHPAFSR